MPVDQKSYKEQHLKIGTPTSRKNWGLHHRHQSVVSLENIPEPATGEFRHRVLNNLVGLSISSFQEYYLSVSRVGENFNVVKEEGVTTQYLIEDVAKLLYKSGVPPSDLQTCSKVGVEVGTLYLLLSKNNSGWVVSGGGTISRDFTERDNPVFFDINFADEKIAREVFELIKLTPNQTLEEVVYGAIEPDGSGKYLPMCKTRESNRGFINPFSTPIKRVVSGELVK